MSEAVSAVMGARSTGEVEVADAGLMGMITLRGDLGSKAVASAVKGAVGANVPQQRKINQGKNGSVAWMSPDELLLLVDYAKVEAVTDQMTAELGGEHSLAVNVSDARAMFTLKGAGVREVIAKGSPADMSVAAFGVGDFRRSRVGQVAAAFWMTSNDEAHLVCFRSVGDFMFKWLTTAAKPGGLPGVL